MLKKKAVIIIIIIIINALSAVCVILFPAEIVVLQTAQMVPIPSHHASSTRSPHSRPMPILTR